MRQAIDEDLFSMYEKLHHLRNLLQIVKACDDDPNVERKKAAKALARFMKLHPHNIAQKTE